MSMTDTDPQGARSPSSDAPGAEQAGQNEHSEKITSLEGVPALSLDAISSVAYGPEAMLVVLATAGAGALAAIEPITLAIVVLLVILVFSYRQVIAAYPGGGGCYAVSKANLGRPASLLAGAALIIDYVLTVAVSIAAGVAALVSAFPGLRPDSLAIGLGTLAVLTALNLRGLATSARALLLPTAVFILGIYVVIVAGLFRQHPAAGAGVHQVPVPAAAAAVGVLLILKAFAAGCSALTGVEAIANDVPAFREPSARRAMRTELLLGGLLGTMLIGLAILTVRFHIAPSGSQTVLSQITGASVGPRHHPRGRAEEVAPSDLAESARGGPRQRSAAAQRCGRGQDRIPPR
jgi:amino acid transporter